MFIMNTAAPRLTQGYNSGKHDDKSDPDSVPYSTESCRSEAISYHVTSKVARTRERHSEDLRTSAEEGK